MNVQGCGRVDFFVGQAHLASDSLPERLKQGLHGGGGVGAAHEVLAD